MYIYIYTYYFLSSIPMTQLLFLLLHSHSLTLHYVAKECDGSN